MKNNGSILLTIFLSILFFTSFFDWDFDGFQFLFLTPKIVDWTTRTAHVFWGLFLVPSFPYFTIFIPLLILGNEK